MAVKVNIKILQKNLDKLIESFTTHQLPRYAENVKRELEALAPVADGTNSLPSGSHMRDQFRIGFTTDHGKRVIRIFNDAVNSRGQPYVKFQTSGTSPHIISGNPNLAFHWLSHGVFVVTPSVNHPGQAPNNYVMRALINGFHN